MFLKRGGASLERPNVERWDLTRGPLGTLKNKT
jgi:hypothetical protein